MWLMMKMRVMPTNAKADNDTDDDGNNDDRK